jgi:CO/xanthine dehydrogenase Mo-binding subunit
VSWVGRSLRRREDDRFLRGAGAYVDDLTRPGMLHAAFVRSPYARARVLAVTADAAAPPALLVTAADLPAASLPVQAPPGVTVADAPHPLLSDEVRYVGQPVAMVLADSVAAAVDAAALVEVDYEELPSDPEEMLRFEKSAGDVDGAFARAAHVVRASHAIPRTASIVPSASSASSTSASSPRPW